MQAYLSSKIIEQVGSVDYEVLYISPSAGEVHLHYYLALTKNAKKGSFLIAHEGFSWVGKVIENIYLLYILRRKYVGVKYNCVYMAAIDSVLIQTVLSVINFEVVKSFDDGSANYNYTGIYYNNKKPGTVLRLMGWVFGNRKTKFKIISEIAEHYAINPEKRNVIDNVRAVDLGFLERVGVREMACLRDVSRCSVLIGCVYEAISSEPVMLIEAIESKLCFVDYYIPHPRYSISPVVGLNTLEGPKICEEKIIALLGQYDRVDVYSFGSTALMTLANMPGVRLILIKSGSIKDWPYADEIESQVDEVMLI